MSKLFKVCPHLHLPHLNSLLLAAKVAGNVYWRNPFYAACDSASLSHFTVMEVEMNNNRPIKSGEGNISKKVTNHILVFSSTSKFILIFLWNNFLKFFWRFKTRFYFHSSNFLLIKNLALIVAGVEDLFTYTYFEGHVFDINWCFSVGGFFNVFDFEYLKISFIIR